jgi:hypothetical protein
MSLVGALGFLLVAFGHNFQSTNWCATIKCERLVSRLPAAYLKVGKKKALAIARKFNI